MFQKRIRLANTVLSVDAEMSMELGGHLPLFVTNDDPDVMVQIRYAQQDENVGYGKCEKTDIGYLVVIPQGVYPRLSLWQIFSLIPMDTILMERGTVIFHANFLLHNGEAISFSGQSGIGKSTQGGLWAAAGEGEVINGDRVLLTVLENGVQVDSHYLCGTSGICSNVSAPLRAIVMLEKGKENVISVPSALERFRQIISQMSYRPSDPTHRMYISGLAGKILEMSQVIHFSCRKDHSAVCDLMNYLY